MDESTATITPEVEVPAAPAAPVEPAPPPPPEKPEEPSLAKHQEALGYERDEDSGRFVKPKHRTRRDAARSEDVPRIKELTAKQRAAEQERDTYKARVAELEAQHAQPAPVVESPAPRIERREHPALAPGADGFAEPQPKLDDFAGAEDQ